MFVGGIVNLTGCVLCQYHAEFCLENIKCVVRVGSACDPSIRGKIDESVVVLTLVPLFLYSEVDMHFGRIQVSGMADDI